MNEEFQNPEVALETYAEQIEEMSKYREEIIQLLEILNQYFVQQQAIHMLQDEITNLQTQSQYIEESLASVNGVQLNNQQIEEYHRFEQANMELKQNINMLLQQYEEYNAQLEPILVFLLEQGVIDEQGELTKPVSYFEEVQRKIEVALADLQQRYASLLPQNASDLDGIKALLGQVINESAQQDILQHYQPDKLSMDPQIQAFLEERLIELGMDVETLKQTQPKTYELMMLLYQANSQANSQEEMEAIANQLQQLTEEQVSIKSQIFVANQLSGTNRSHLSICNFINQCQELGNEQQL